MLSRAERKVKFAWEVAGLIILLLLIYATRSILFPRGCDVCKCERDGDVSCKREPFCNLNVSVEEDFCSSSGGFYYRICNGPYFDIVCSKNKYCICGGLINYQCGEGYECLYDFVSPNKRTMTIEGFKDLLGRDLGLIGVCGK